MNRGGSCMAVRGGFGVWDKEPREVNAVKGRADPAVSNEIGRGLGPRAGNDENTHPAPKILWAGHPTRLSTSVSPTESIGGCGGRRSCGRVEKERDGDVRMGFWNTRQVDARIVGRYSQAADCLLS